MPIEPGLEKTLYKTIKKSTGKKVDLLAAFRSIMISEIGILPGQPIPMMCCIDVDSLWMVNEETALGIPLISVDTLQVLAKKVVVKDGLIVPMLDARRMEVYSAIFDKSYSKIKEVQAEILTENSYAEITDTIYFIGDCQEKCKTVLTATNFHFLSKIVFPSANEMSALSYKKFFKNDFEDVAYFEPFYLKDFLITK